MARPKKAITQAQIKAELIKRKQFKRKLNTEHFLASKAEYVCHQIDEDIINAHRAGKVAPGQDVFFSLMDDCLDASKGEYYIHWTDDNIKSLWEGVLYRSLGLLRYAKADSIILDEELEWICSDNFDFVCNCLELDASMIRIEVPQILKKYAGLNEVLNTNKYAKALCEYKSFIFNGGISKSSNSHLYSELEGHEIPLWHDVKY